MISPLRKRRQHVDPYQLPCRWLQKRMTRYSHINCDFCDATMLEDVGNGSAGCVVPPLLPFLLAACAPSAKLKLFVAPDQGWPPMMV